MPEALQNAIGLYIIDSVPVLQLSETIKAVYLTGVHDFMVLGRGRYLATGYCSKTVYNIPEDVPHSVYGARVLVMVVQEIKDGQLVWQWDSTERPELYGLSLYDNGYYNCSTQWVRTN